jgi:hypothetical protein
MQPLLDLHLQLKGFRYLQTTVKKKAQWSNWETRGKPIAITNSEMEVSNSMLAMHFERLAPYKKDGMDKQTKSNEI